ncbi:hypothetical protein ACO9S2_06520 [Nitrospira sp. NS4]|uniref:hypothetical protein n=1 Tax=Nitrospira sp. NS4 TaxID=3414498 RepID=UPI003C2DA55E
MKQWLPAMLVVGLAVVMMTGCRGGGQVYEVKDTPVQTATGKAASMEEVQKAIIGAGAKLGWIMAVAKPGEIVGTLNVRTHTAIVTIPFSEKNYSILYKDSTNLKYDADKQTIHQNYSGWIQRLDNEIRARLSTLGM